MSVYSSGRGFKFLIQFNRQSLTTLAPTLFPFFRHTITSVRLAVVKTLHSFLQVPTLPNGWVTPQFLRLLVQNLVVEERADIRNATLDIWHTVLKVLRPDPSSIACLFSSDIILDWYTLAMTPLGIPIDPSTLYRPSESAQNGHGPVPERHNVDKNMLAQDLALISVETVFKARIAVAKAFAWLLAEWPEQGEPLDNVFRPILEHYIKSPSMLQKFLSAVIVEEWSLKYDDSTMKTEMADDSKALLTDKSVLAKSLSREILEFLQSDPPVAYHEMTLSLGRLFSECSALLQSFVHDCKISQSSIPFLGSTVDIHGTEEGAFSIVTAQNVAGPIFTKLKESLGRTKKKELIILQDKRQRLSLSIQHYNEIKTQHDIRVSAAFAAAGVALKLHPDKVSPIVKGIMNGIKVLLDIFICNNY